jgi:hypothetical protein
MEATGQHTTPTTLPQGNYTGTHKAGDRVDVPEPVLRFWTEKSIALIGIQIPYRSVRSLVTTSTTLSLSLELIYAFFYEHRRPTTYPVDIASNVSSIVDK